MGRAGGAADGDGAPRWHRHHPARGAAWRRPHTRRARRAPHAPRSLPRHRRAPRPRARGGDQQPNEDGGHQSVQHVGHRRREEELLREEDDPEDGADDEERAEDLADAAIPDGRHGRILHVADHQEAQAEHDEAQHLVPGEVGDHRLRIQVGLAEPVVRGEGPSGRGRGEAGEVRLLAPRLLDVEARQANHGAHREHEAEDPIPPRLIEDGEVDDHRGREAERDRVDQGVELLAEATPAVGGASDAPVEGIGHTPEDDVRHRPREVAARRGDDREDAEEQVRQREPVREEDDRAARLRTAHRHRPPSRAMSVVPAKVVCPTFTFGVAVVGRKTSTREPKRMIPMRSACSTASPSRL